MKRRFFRFFRKAQDYAKTDLVYLVKGGFWVGISRVFFIITAFVLSVAFANLLPAHEYGVYRYILSLATIAATFSLTGLGETITRSAANNIKGILKWGVTTSLKWSVLSVLIALIFSGYYYMQGNAVIGTGILIVGLLNPLIISYQLYNPFLIGRKEFKKVSLYAFWRRLIPIGALVGALFLTDDPVILLTVFFGSSALTMLSVYLKIAKEYPEKASEPKDVFSFTKHLSLMNILVGLAGQLDKILVFHFLGGVGLAIYAFALLPGSQIQGLFRTATSLILPKVSTQDLSILQKTLPRKSLFFLAAIAPIVFLYIIAAPYIYELFFPQYMESVPYSQVFALTTLFVPLSVFGQTLVGHMKKKEMWILKTIIPTVRIITLLVLLPLFGIWGAVAAQLIERVVSFVLTIYLFKKA